MTTFVGRGPELAALLAAFRDESVSMVLLSGEAGIGKSRLVHEFTTRLGAQPLVLTGRCLEFGNDGLPFAPFVGVMRGLTPGSSTSLAAWLPDLALPVDRFRLFGEVLTVLERAAEARPLVLVLEDLHWADASSLELLTFLVANLGHSGVFLVGTHRAPAGALRHLVAELARLPAVHRVALAPLSRHEAGRHLAALLGREPEPTLVARVFERSRGNPLFVEALSGSPEDTPAELLELLRAQLPELTGDAGHVLTVAAVAGTVVEHEVLAAVAGLPERDLHHALRYLVDKHALLPTDTGYAFRHALIRQAVYDLLLPVEKTRRHAEFATALLTMPEHVAELAAHAYAAGDHPRALAAAWQAAARARRTGAEAERLHLLHRVLELWPKVDDAPAVAGVDRLTVLDHAVEASLATSAVSTGLGWSAEALAIAPDARRYLRQARLKNLGNAGGREDLLQALALSDQALLRGDAQALLGGEVLAEEGLLRGEILAELAAGSVFAGDPARATQDAEAALEIAGRLGDTRLAARAHSYLGLAKAADPAAAYRHFAAARTAADPRTTITVALWEASARHAFGEHAAAIEVIQLGLRTAHESFEYARHAPILVVKWVQALTALGRWPEALELIDEALGEPDLPRLSHAALLISRAEIQLAQGDRSAALTTAGGAEELLGDESWVSKYRIRLRTLQIRLTPARAAEIYAATLATEDLAAHPHEAWPLLAAATPTELPDVPVTGPVDEAYRAMATGDLQTAARIWRELGQPHELSQCQPQPADSRREAPRQSTLGLTARELEVLTLVAEGKSNRQIAAELYISGNTAGVHVSRILAKLGAATRTEAARKLLDTNRMN
ncbi:helix-turn-helix transcriptional regulator [Longispora fulva]|uniref:DNA-binding CsgD family transcriptional regulator n=1 Tax=Longispora fulva TaxID=619741 RepID=A0A8J7KXY1_9ACTN|nr:LuxR family transcriptional regulator [Longispora fulva]MBG6138482.1 DNA-binding CsgD family transcriptional regulator [Longispora fulva]GIG62412.1 helix-turn-helix transcriptional regulator [Longispora fulva]